MKYFDIDHFHYVAVEGDSMAAAEAAIALRDVQHPMNAVLDKLASSRGESAAGNAGGPGLF